jgi:hypothetical protein
MDGYRDGGILIYGGMNMVAEKLYDDTCYLKLTEHGEQGSWAFPVRLSCNLSE